MKGQWQQSHVTEPFGTCLFYLVHRRLRLMVKSLQLNRFCDFQGLVKSYEFVASLSSRLKLELKVGASAQSMNHSLCLCQQPHSARTQLRYTGTWIRVRFLSTHALIVYAILDTHPRSEHRGRLASVRSGGRFCHDGLGQEGTIATSSRKFAHISPKSFCVSPFRCSSLLFSSCRFFIVLFLLLLSIFLLSSTYSYIYVFIFI